jgi:hypothetical protein
MKATRLAAFFSEGDQWGPTERQFELAGRRHVIKPRRQVNGSVKSQDDDPLLRSIAEVARGARAVAEQYAPAIHEASQVLVRVATEWGSWIQIACAEVDRTARLAQSLGMVGWTMPLNASIEDWYSLVNTAYDAASADTVFDAYYANHNGAARHELLQNLLARSDLADWRPLIAEVAFALDAEKYRLCIPSLLATFEGVASRWSDRFGKQSGRNDFFRRTLRGMEANSFDSFAWSAMEAFVDTLYAQAKQTKPLILNRHWILHGRSPSEANLTDCLRLLQAIHTALELDLR